MKLAIIGRTQMLADVARHLSSAGHTIGAVVTVPDESAIFAPLTRELGAAFLETKSINSDAALAFLKASNCDVAISINWIALIHQPAIDCFAHGILNAHGGDLPRYRGNACQNWAILRGEQRVGLCVHAMDSGLDSGPVYQRKHLKLTDQTYIGEVYDWFAQVMPGMFAESIAMIERSESPTPQNPHPRASLRTYPRRPEDSRIDWKLSAQDLHRLVRASSKPFDGAFCFLEDGRKVTIWRAAIAKPAGEHIAMPGQPCSATDEDPMIACGDGFLRLETIEIEGLAEADAKREISKSVRRRLV